MSTATVSTKSIDLAAFDFSVERPRFTSSEPHDGSVTIRLPGKNRKTANHELQFTPYFKKHNLKFKTVAIGKNKDNAPPHIVVFDQQDLSAENANIREYGQVGGFINSKGHAMKILDIFDVPLRGRPGEVIKLYFQLHPTYISRNKPDYRICLISAMKIIKNERKMTMSRKSPKPKLKKAPDDSSVQPEIPNII